MTFALRRFALLAPVLISVSMISGPAGAINIAQGTLSGVRDGAVTAYRGIPYAAAPVGELRWRAPQPAPRWTGVRRADTFGPNCRQELPKGALRAWTPEYLITGPVSEYCLTLNVWTTGPKLSAKLPVLVWIHGGAFSSGGASVPVYDGAILARQGIIVVTVNYRLGVYGFLSHPQLRKENAAGASGNYGLQDQIAALRWVQANIAAFGGDPQRVTVAGQSAGAASVHHLIASPLAEGLFHQAIAESGSGMGLSVPNSAAADAAGTKLISAAGVADLAALRQLSPVQLEAAANGQRFGPVIDGAVLPSPAHVERNTNDVPVLTGMTADEGSSMGAGYASATPDALAASLRAALPNLQDEAVALYPAASDAEAGAAKALFARERALAAMQLWAEKRMQGSKQPIYAYLFTHVEPGPQSGLYKAFHSSEIPYVFGTLDAARRPFKPADRALSRQVRQYWANWVKHGNPNGAGLPNWPRLSPDAPQILEIGEANHSYARARPLLPDAKLKLFKRHVEQGGALGLFMND